MTTNDPVWPATRTISPGLGTLLGKKSDLITMHETAEATRHLSHDVISSARSFHRTQRSHLFQDACWIGSVVLRRCRRVCLAIRREVVGQARPGKSSRKRLTGTRFRRRTLTGVWGRACRRQEVLAADIFCAVTAGDWSILTIDQCRPLVTLARELDKLYIKGISPLTNQS